jgi:hypothetical protein
LRDARIGARICERLNFIDEPLEVYPLLSNFIATNCKRLSRKPDIKDRNSFGRWIGLQPACRFPRSFSV